MTQARNPGPPPQSALIQIVYGPFVARMVAAAAELGIPDQLAGGPQASDTLAATLGLDPDSVGRLMRTLVGTGVFEADENGEFRNGPMAEILRSDAPGSMREYVIYASSLELMQAWDRVIEVLRTGRPSFKDALGMEFWEYGQAHPEFGARFDRAMTALGAGAPRALLSAAADDLSRFRTVVDVGGGHGHYLASIVAAVPTLRGVLFDLPTVVGSAGDVLGRSGVSDRIEVLGGDVFESVPAGHDVYLFKTVLHDWNDQDARTILQVCRRAVRPDSEVWLVEVVLPAGAQPHPGRFPDMHMMVTVGGRERTEADWRELLGSAGFTLARVVPMPGPHSIVVARPV